MDNKELQHHGIIGMKWGVRRYQNKDGSLTAAGKRRASTDKAKARAKKITSDAKEEAKKIALRTKNKAIVDNAKKEAETIKSKARGESSDTKPKEKSVNEMTVDELRKAVERKRLEKEYKSYMPPEKQGFWKTAGKEVLKPAAIAAGKSIATKLFVKWGEQALGLDEGTKKALKEAGKEVKKAVGDTNGKKKSKDSSDDSSNASGSKKAKKDDVEIIEPSKDAWRNTVKSTKPNPSTITPNDPAAAPYKAIGEETVNKYLTELTGDDFWGE